MEKIELYLIAVGFLGLIIGWFISKEFFRKKDINRIESLSNTINEREIYLKNLEIDCAEKQNKLDRLIDESILCKHELLQKSNLLRKKSDELYKIQKGLDNNSYDTQELQRLRMIIIKKDKLIENRKKDNSSYIEISKDQFQQIEKRLKEYKHKADTLEEENTRLSILNSSNKEFDFFKKVNYSISNMKAIALSNLFKDNYEKLTKA
jgi:chromosome segregation ATPase